MRRWCRSVTRSLTPEYTHSISLNFLKTWEQHTLSISTYYRPTTDVMQRIRYQNADDGMMYMTQMNLTKRQSLGVEIIGKNKALPYPRPHHDGERVL